MSTQENRRAVPRLAQLNLVALAVVSALAGCAAIPQTPKAVALKAPADYAATTSLAAVDAACPQNEWWRAYGDPQLDTLVADALRDSPTLDITIARLRGA